MSNEYKILKVNKKQEKILKDMFSMDKAFTTIGIKHDSPKLREQKIDRINYIEDMEKQLEKQ